MKRKSLYQLILVLVILVIAIKYVPPVNSWARANLPESVLTLIGEKPKDVFERSADMIGESIKKGTNLVEDIVEKVKTRK
ncbi:MAG: hypothetical protein D4R93_04130 [Deltaproteobacteria bacterium]|nr:MAG: hypothetical protein D4R93_04130 [Deltaproteobacteria bacterium]